MLTANEIVTLKSKVKAEMARRSGYGSLSSFSGTAYDFATSPKQGGIILAEHGQKTIDLLLQIKDKDNLVLVKQNALIPDGFDSSLITYVDTLAKETMTGSTSSCRGACTGLCVGTCSGGCNGCSGGCSGGCYGTCTGGCANSCTGGCGTACTGCGTTCAAACGG